MSNDDIESLTILTWNDIREEVRHINLELAEIIDRLSPGDEFKIIKARYNFGDLIVKEGQLQLPKHSHSPEKIAEYLSYSQIPLTLLMNKQCEIFVTEGERIIPLKVFGPGQFFGLFETINMMFDINRSPNWNVTAGGRSIFTLPKISTNVGLKRLRQHFGLSLDSNAHSLSSHWNLFKEIAAHQNFQEPWTSEVIFFTSSWFNYKKTDPAWVEFNYYLLKSGWLGFQQFLTREQVATSWKSFVKAIVYRRLRPTAYIADTFRHLLLIAIGEAPAFIPATNSLIAPRHGLQKALIDVYQLENYFPTIMQPILPTIDSQQNVYYSLSLPTLLEGTPDSKNNSSTLMFDLKMIKMLMDTLQKDDTAKASFLQGKQLDFFHAEPDIHNEVNHSTLILKEDDDFLIEAEQYNDKIFCSTSAFWRGCIRIRV